MTFKELLKQQNFTQERLAQSLHITQVAVSKWVRGLNTPTWGNTSKIAKILDVDFDVVVHSFYSKGG